MEDKHPVEKLQKIVKKLQKICEKCTDETIKEELKDEIDKLDDVVTDMDENYSVTDRWDYSRD